MDINNLFSNPIIKKAALGSLIKAMKNNNVKTAIIHYDPVTDDLSFEFHPEGMVTIPSTDLETYKAALQKSLEL